ncbi:MAG: ABC transporter ATP-binding protein [Acidobacteriota bacterium]|nr:ABC transporter ATP-binding protein [Acidobacteriota bacterium]
MSDFREEEKLGKIYDTRLTRRLLGYLRPYRWLVALVFSFTLAWTGTQLIQGYLWKVVIDGYIDPGFAHKIARNIALRGVLIVAVIYLSMLLASFVLQYAQVRIMLIVGQRTMYDLRKEIFERLQRLPVSFFDRSPIGRLVTRATTDVDALNDLFASGVVAMLNDFVMLFGMAIFLTVWNWRLALATFSPLPFMLVLTYLFRNQVRDANRRIRTGVARINAFLQEHISGMALVQLFNREKMARQQFVGLNREYLHSYKDAIQAYAYFLPGVEFLSMSGVALLYWIGGVRVFEGTVDVGLLFSFMVYAQQFYRPIQDLSDKFNILQTAMAASERIFSLLDEPVTITSPAHVRELPAPRGEIEFRSVWFAYHGGANPKDDEWVLRDVSFRVDPGQTLAIVGHTGAGKTTIIQLLLRFYEIQRGSILLDGVDIRQLDLQDLRRLFGIVLQDPFLFTGTLESNVKLGTPNIDRAACERALREVGLGSLIDSSPNGIETPVNERGGGLSVGQRQLVSFARALAHNPKFLILDEATSSVDTKTELLIREALDRLLTGRTAVVIAHRLSTIQHANRILVFHKGRLREQGSHQELLAQRGIYHRLYQLQYKEQELELSLPSATAGGFGHPIPADD